METAYVENWELFSLLTLELPPESFLYSATCANWFHTELSSCGSFSQEFYSWGLGINTGSLGNLRFWDWDAIGKNQYSVVIFCWRKVWISRGDKSVFALQSLETFLLLFLRVVLLLTNCFLSCFPLSLPASLPPLLPSFSSFFSCFFPSCLPSSDPASHPSSPSAFPFWGFV